MADKLKDNQDGGGVNASDPQAAGKSIEKIESKEGSGKGKYHGSGDGHMDMDKKDGSGKMGYTQTWGAGRQNGYAKGASKVNSIMKGAGQVDPEKMKNFLIGKGEEMTEQKRNELVNEAAVDAFGQYGDSLNLVRTGQNLKAQEMYGKKLAPGNVAGINVEEFPEGVSPNVVSGGEFMKNKNAYQFEGDDNVRIRKTGRALLKEYGDGSGRNPYGGNKGDESRSKRDYEG
jgi:hypothetical protein